MSETTSEIATTTKPATTPRRIMFETTSEIATKPATTPQPAKTTLKTKPATTPQPAKTTLKTKPATTPQPAKTAMSKTTSNPNTNSPITPRPTKTKRQPSHDQENADTKDDISDDTKKPFVFSMTPDTNVTPKQTKEGFGMKEGLKVNLTPSFVKQLARYPHGKDVIEEFPHLWKTETFFEDGYFVIGIDGSGEPTVDNPKFYYSFDVKDYVESSDPHAPIGYGQAMVNIKERDPAKLEDDPNDKIWVPCWAKLLNQIKYFKDRECIVAPLEIKNCLDMPYFQVCPIRTIDNCLHYLDTVKAAKILDDMVRPTGDHFVPRYIALLVTMHLTMLRAFPDLRVRDVDASMKNKCLDRILTTDWRNEVESSYATLLGLFVTYQDIEARGLVHKIKRRGAEIIIDENPSFLMRTPSDTSINVPDSNNFVVSYFDKEYTQDRYTEIPGCGIYLTGKYKDKIDKLAEFVKLCNDGDEERLKTPSFDTVVRVLKYTADLITRGLAPAPAPAHSPEPAPDPVYSSEPVRAHSPEPAPAPASVHS